MQIRTFDSIEKELRDLSVPPTPPPPPGATKTVSRHVHNLHPLSWGGGGTNGKDPSEVSSVKLLLQSETGDHHTRSMFTCNYLHLKQDNLEVYPFVSQKFCSSFPSDLFYRIDEPCSFSTASAK